jgi:hypothetical protein
MLSTASALTYSEWIAGYPSLTGASALATADPDGDGIPNLMEFALDGLDPTFGNTQPTVFMRQVRNTDGTYATPTTGRILSSDLSSAASVHGVLKYKKRAGVTGLLYIPQTNQKNLNDWGWGDSAITEWTDSGYTYARTISDMKVWDGRGFMRLKVEVQ